MVRALVQAGERRAEHLSTRIDPFFYRDSFCMDRNESIQQSICLPACVPACLPIATECAFKDNWPHADEWRCRHWRRRWRETEGIGSARTRSRR